MHTLANVRARPMENCARWQWQKPSAMRNSLRLAHRRLLLLLAGTGRARE